jgi:DUF1680 family protein
MTTTMSSNLPIPLASIDFAGHYSARRVLGAMAGCLLAACCWTVLVTAAGGQPPHEKFAKHALLRPLEPTAVQWTNGFWGHRYQQCRQVIVPHMWKVMNLPDNAATFQDLRKAAGLINSNGPGGVKWSDGDCHKLVEAMARLFEQNREVQLEEWMDEAIAAIAQAQEPDGYLSSWVQLSDEERWADLHNHELYNMGHLMTAASVHYRATGKDSYLQVARRTGDYLHGVFAKRPPSLAHFGFNPSNIMGAIDLYRATGDAKYLELAKIFVNMRGSRPGGGNQNQARVPLRKESEAVGHCVTATYLWCGAADVYEETGDDSLLAALQRLWKDVTSHKMYVTGGTAALHFGSATRKTFPWPRDSVHEAFGAEFQLPNRTAYNETCANIGHAMWNWRMLNLTGDAQYAEVVERVLYNSMLSSISLDGESFFYTNPLRRASAEVDLMSNDSFERWSDTTPDSPVHCFCCPPSVARTIAKIHQWSYSRGQDSLWIHLYGSNQLELEWGEDSNLKLVQTTDYPWSGKVEIRIEQAPPTALTLRPRIPQWAANAAIRVNNQPIADDLQGGTYASIQRVWRSGDVVEISLPMEIVFLESHPLIEETRNHVAVMRGPIVYCLESPDLPADIQLDHVRIDVDGTWTCRWDQQLLGGITVLEGPFAVAESAAWDGQLYRPLRRASEQEMRTRLIPYFAWSNRGRSQMTVWIPTR